MASIQDYSDDIETGKRRRCLPLAPLSDMEWLGWEVAAARHLEIGLAPAAVLRLMVQRAPGICRGQEMVLAASESVSGSRHRAPAKNNVIKVHVHHLKLAVAKALADVAPAVRIECVPRIGYRLTADDAADIFFAVAGSLPDGGRSA